MRAERIYTLPTISTAMVFVMSASLLSCRKSPGATEEKSPEQAATPSLLSSKELTPNSKPAQESSPGQPAARTASDQPLVYPSTIVDLPPNSSANGAPRQAKQMRVTSRPDGSELERTYLDERGQEFLTVRNSEDGVVEISRTFDADGKVVRERTTLNGVDQSAVRKAAQ